MLLEIWFSRQSTTLPVIITYLSHIYHHLCKHKAGGGGGHAFLVYWAQFIIMCTYADYYYTCFPITLHAT